MSRNSRKCEICEKTEYGTYKEKLFYAAFPVDEVRCREWLRVVGKSELVHLPIEKLHKNRFLCGNHFERKAFNKKRNRLKKNAIPKLNLRFTPLTKHELREFPQHMRSCKKDDLKMSITVSNNESSNPEPPLHANPRKNIGEAHTDDLKMSITVSNNESSNPEPPLHANPRKNIGEAHTVVPPKQCATTRTPKNTSTDVLRPSKRIAEESFSSASSSNIQQTPSKKTKLQGDPVFTPRKKKLDEMALKPRLIYNAATDQVDGFQDLGVSEDGCGRSADVADHALLFIVQGLYKKFKQPVALYFVKNTISSQKLAVLIKEIITAINGTGFRVLTTVCDQGPSNMGALKLLKDWSGPSIEDNAFVVNDKKICIVYDVPHLFKSIRNNFLKNRNIFIDGKVGKWCHLVSVEEKNRNFLYLSKITSTHVNPKYRAKMKVKYAAQALSNTVSAVLKLLSEAENNKGNSREAQSLLETALVVEDLDRLFDCTNGPSGPDDVKYRWRQNVSSKTDHLEKWAAYEKKLNNLKFTNDMGTSAKNVKCTQGYVTTLKSLRSIWLTVSDLGFKHFNLRQVNQDALENLFGIIRQHSPTNRNPTCAHFMAALKTAIITNLTAPHSRGSNCQKDGNQLLTNFHQLIFPQERETLKETPQEEVELHKVQLQEEDLDLPVINLADDQLYDEIEEDLERVEVDHAVIYISGYLASRVLKKNNCEECKICLSVNDTGNLDDPIYSYIKLREWWSDRQALTYPTKKLCYLVDQATTATEKEICPHLFTLNVGQLVATVYSAQCETNWFTCARHKNNVIETLFVLLGHLLIRRQCQRINQSFALQEESLADTVKKAQQQGQAK